MPWAGARSAAWPTCCRPIAIWPTPQHRAEVAALWGVPSVPEKPGKTAVEMFQAAADGEIKALWIACTNPAQSMPDQSTVRRALERAEFVVVQEAFATTATCDFADLLLPATTWGEKTGTVTNSERRISRVRPAVPKPAGTRHDWEIAAEFARRLERKLRPGQATLFPYSLTDDRAGAEAIWNEHRESTRGRDLDITGMSYALLEEAPLQWPMPAGAGRGQGPPVRGRRLPHRRWQGSLRQRGVPAGGRTARIPLPVLADHRAAARPVARHEPHRHAGPAVRPRGRTVRADEPAGHVAPAAQRRRPGACHQQARLHRRAGAGQQ